MTRLLEIKAIMVALYKKYDTVMNLIGKFIFSFIVLIRLNLFFSYSPLMSKISLNIVLAIIAAFFPSSWFLLLLMFVVIIQLFSASIEVMLMITVLMIVVYLLFGRLQPKYSWFIIAVPFFASIQMVYIVPLVAGLFFGIGTIIPISVGLGVYHFSRYLPGLMNLSGQGVDFAESPNLLIDMYNYLGNVILNDKSLVLMIFVCTVVILVMYFVKQMQMDYIWYIAIATGALTYIVTYSIGNMIFNTQMGLIWPFFGTLIAAVLVAIMQFFRFSLDYKRAEKLQFEDDDYYYYVKTIPKVKAIKAQKEVKRL